MEPTYGRATLPKLLEALEKTKQNDIIELFREEKLFPNEVKLFSVGVVDYCINFACRSPVIQTIVELKVTQRTRHLR